MLSCNMIKLVSRLEQGQVLISFLQTSKAQLYSDKEKRQSSILVYKPQRAFEVFQESSRSSAKEIVWAVTNK